MTSAWQIKEGQLTRRWSGRMGHNQYDAPWMQTAPDIRSGYLPPTPNFASHSPFGGPTWFWSLPRDYYRNSQ